MSTGGSFLDRMFAWLEHAKPYPRGQVCPCPECVKFREVIASILPVKREPQA